MTRRARLIAGLVPWADARPCYSLRLGSAVLPFEVLTDEALADLRSRIARDVRSERLVAAFPVILGSDRSLHRHCVQMPGEGLRIATASGEAWPHHHP